MIESVKKCKPYSVSIHIAGDLGKIEELCQEYCDLVGDCVTVTPTKYIYKKGQEGGARIGFINYPRFPREKYEIKMRAVSLADSIAIECKQMSYTIETPEEMIYHYDSELKPMPKEKE